jgi:hypothetical protein
MVTALLVTGIMPVFLYALYRNEGTLRISKRLGILALAAACVRGLQVAWGLPAVIKYAGPRRGASVLDPQQPWTVGQLVPLLGQIGNVAFMLLLISIYRESDRDPAAEVPSSQFLRATTVIASVAWGAWLAFNVFRLAATPFSYSIFRDVALRSGMQPPGLWKLTGGVVNTLLSQACYFVAPFVVYRSLKWREAARAPF